MALIENMVGNGVLAGLTATLVMTFLMILGRYFKIAQFSFSQSLGKTLLGPKSKDKFARPFGFVIHLLVGTGWGIIYVILADLLGFGVNVISGVIFGLIPWLAMMLVFLPSLGAGLFGERFDKRLKDSLLLFHIFYGLVLGLMASL